MLDIDGHRLTQSLAIINYLDLRFANSPLIPAAAAERAHVVAMAMAIACDIHPLNNLRVLKYLKDEFGRSQEDVDAWYAHWISEGLPALEAMAAPRAGKFLFGDAPTGADVCLVPQLYNARRFNVPLDAYPTLLRADENANNMEAFAAAHPDRTGGTRMNRVDSINRGMDKLKPLQSVEIPSLEGKVSDEEWAIRVDLACAYRMVAHYGWDDLIFTHLSARIPGPDHHFLLNPYNLMFEEVTASSLVKVDLERQSRRSDAVHHQSRRLHHPFGHSHGARRCACGHASAHARGPGGFRAFRGTAAVDADRHVDPR